MMNCCRAFTGSVSCQGMAQFLVINRYAPRYTTVTHIPSLIYSYVPGSYPRRALHYFKSLRHLTPAVQYLRPLN